MRPWFALIAVPAIFAPVEPAVARDYLTLEQAQRVLFPNASGFALAPVSLTREQLAQIKQLSGTPQRTANPKVWRALQGGKLSGWLIVDEVVGKHEFITYATAISPEGAVLGIEIMSYRESRGGEVMNPKWRALFRGKKVTDPFKLNKDIPNISGATLSSRNITDGVKRLLVLHRVALAGRS
jgi:Na+-translocating ferredoxin:NAD+ oxidoreductase RnfG subunit